jgi:hypothetical protein
MDKLKKYLDSVKREEEIQVKDDELQKETLIDQQNEYVDLINPIMSKIYDILLENLKSLQEIIKAKNMYCDLKAIPIAYGGPGKLIKHNEITLSLGTLSQSKDTAGELIIKPDDIRIPKINIITAINYIPKAHIIEINAFDDDTMEEYIIEFLKNIFSQDRK